MRSVPALQPLAAGPHSLNIVGISGSGKLAQAGELLGITISGAHTGIAVSDAYVYLPPQYFQPAYSHARFPVVLALTGYPASSSGLIDRLKIPGTAAALVAHQ